MYAVTAVVTLGLIGGFLYWRTKDVPACSAVLEEHSENYACISTNFGVMVFELYPDAAPKTVEHLEKLANEKQFYDGLEFYRVVRNFVVQGGIQDYQVRTTGIDNVPEPYASKIALGDETIDTEVNLDNFDLSEEERTGIEEEGYTSNKDLKSRKFAYGALAFASSGPNTESTEIFIVLGKEESNYSFLNGRFANIGGIVRGEDVLEKIGNLEIDEDYKYAQGQSEKPVDTIEIFEIRVK